VGRKKKIYLDENGNPCKRHQTPEFKAKRQTPEFKAREKARKQTPEARAKQKAYRERPEIKAREKARYQTPEHKARRNAEAKDYYQRPEVKTKIKARQQTPEYKAERKAYGQTPERKAKRKAEYHKKIFLDENGNPCKRHQTPEYKAKRSAYAKSYYYAPEGKAKDQAYKALRKAAKLQSKVLLNKAQRKAIVEIYANRPKGWHVDHIVPLQGETITGLHHPDNLQYLPAWVNCMKKNRWDDSWASHTMDTPSLEEKIKAYSLVQV